MGRAGFGVRIEPALAQHVVGQHVGVAAQQDVGASAGHVRGDGHGAHAARLRDDVCLALVVLRVQGLVLDAALVQQARQLLGALDGHGADEAGLARLVALGHVVGHGVELRLHRAVDEVVLVLSGDWAVRRDGHDRQLVDLAELGVLGHGRAGHAGELLVQAEVVLQRDGGQRLVLLAHEHALFRLERLVQALGVAAAFHDAAGELVDDLHLAVHHDVVHVAVEQELGLERLLQVVRQLAGRVGVDVVDAEHGLDLLQAASSMSKSASGTRPTMTRANLLYVSAACVPAPEMMSGVRASSMRMESTSSTMAKWWPRCTRASARVTMLSRR